MCVCVWVWLTYYVGIRFLCFFVMSYVQLLVLIFVCTYTLVFILLSCCVYCMCTQVICYWQDYWTYSSMVKIASFSLMLPYCSLIYPYVLSLSFWLPRYGPPTRTDYRIIVENISSRVSWQASPHICLIFWGKKYFFLYNIIVCNIAPIKP